MQTQKRPYENMQPPQRCKEETVTTEHTAVSKAFEDLVAAFVYLVLAVVYGGVVGAFFGGLVAAYRFISNLGGAM